MDFEDLKIAFWVLCDWNYFSVRCIIK